MKYPLRFSFKILALAPQIYIYDADGNEVFYVKQKMFKLKEDIEVYRTSARQELVARIKANAILDFSAQYNFTDPDGTVLGAVRRKGWRSIFKAEYHIVDDEELHALTVREDSAMVKVMDGMLGQLPLVGFVLTMLINPSFTVSTLEGDRLFQIQKKPAFFEGKFELHRLRDDVDPAVETRSILAVMMMLLLERTRG